jgi:perosamine synthetase
MEREIFLFKSFSDSSDLEAIKRVLDRGTFWASGPEVKDFEESIAKFNGKKHAIAFNSGTSALQANLLAINIKSKEVIVPSFTFPATINSVILAGGIPVFADIEEETLCLDSNDVERKITQNTVAILPIHFGGNVARDIEKLREIADKNKILLIEDNAHSIGAKRNGKMTGTFGKSAMMSFCFNKVLTTGEGGMIVTDSDDLAQQLRIIRSHGRSSDNDYVLPGFNMRMSSMTAALGLSQFKKLDFIISERRRISSLYNHYILKTDKIRKLIEIEGQKSVFQMYNLLFSDEKTRDACSKFLKINGIPSRVTYPPAHLFSSFREKYGSKEGDLPITESISKRILTIPLYLDLKDEEVKYISEKINNFVKADD